MFKKKTTEKPINKQSKVMVMFGQEQKQILCLNGTELWREGEGEYISVLNEDGGRVAYIKASEVIACWVDGGAE